MRVVRFSEYGGPEVLHVAEAAIPPVVPGTVRIRVAAAAVNPADVKWRSGMFRDLVPVTLPHVPGYDVAGTVESVGTDVSGFVAGDRVAGMLDHITKGGYAEFAVASADAICKVPDTVDFVTASAVPTAGLTGVQLIENHVVPEKGQTVLITGATGAVGRFAVLAAINRGARVVAAVRASQISEARELGASDVIVLGEDAWTRKPLDHLADTVGGPAVAALCRHVARGGRIRTVSTTSIDPQGLPEQPQFIAVRPDGRRLAGLLSDVAACRIRVPIARRLPLASAAEAHRLVEAGGLGGKVILEP